MTISRNATEQQQQPDPKSESLTIADVAKLLSLSTATIRNMIFKGELMAYRVGVSGRIIRILKSDFDALWKPLTISNLLEVSHESETN
jgi:excisionase family DNA binding protein